jgi:hypothetical protein
VSFARYYFYSHRQCHNLTTSSISSSMEHGRRPNTEVMAVVTGNDTDIKRIAYFLREYSRECYQNLMRCAESRIKVQGNMEDLELFPLRWDWVRIQTPGDFALERMITTHQGSLGLIPQRDTRALNASVFCESRCISQCPSSFDKFPEDIFGCSFNLLYHSKTKYKAV